MFAWIAVGPIVLYGHLQQFSSLPLHGTNTYTVTVITITAFEIRKVVLYRVAHKETSQTLEQHYNTLKLMKWTAFTNGQCE